MKHQNSDLKMSKIQVTVFKKMKTKYMAIVAHDGCFYGAIMKVGKLKIPLVSV